ncbi:ABC transporter ATP-binding protein [Microtetraspora fusca]|uniref:ABC transporter ATP-binding protein n=1 Tax=Microtetraspora fusca TaxID=1997 RepID=A0ABW6VJU4_MICFU
MNVMAVGADSERRTDHPLIEFDHVGMIYQGARQSFVAVDDLAVAVPRGQFCCVVGPSGCGKSTLLNMVAGLLEPSRGTVRYDGAPVQGPNTRVGYVTQKDNLLPWRSVRRNVGLPLELRGVGKRERAERVDQMLDLVGLAGFGDAYPRELSGGMRKRVTLARTLVYEPEVILADEPFGALDSQLRTVLQDQLVRIWERTRATVVFITHDLGEAVALGDRVVVMSSRPSRVVLDRTIDIPRPRDVFSVRFDPRFAALHEELWAALSPEIEGRGRA